MDIQLGKAGIQHADVIAPLFDAYRIFYGKTSDLPKARAFIGERLEREESVIFYACDREHGAVGIVLETGRGNLGAQRLYESFGYVRDEGYYTYCLALPAPAATGSL